MTDKKRDSRREEVKERDEENTITVAEIREIITRHFTKYHKSISDISRPDSQEGKPAPQPVVEHHACFHDYDAIIKGLFTKNPKSPDMILFDEDTLIFVEFKSGPVKADNIKLKALEGCFIGLHQLVKQHKGDIPFSQITALNKHYIVVHNPEKNNSRIDLQNHFQGTRARFGLEIYKGRFFRDINTWNEEYFIQWLQTSGLLTTKETS